ncbi:MAG: bifunctional (p)ppGpp synthetase/guanosine-3',5'-bis(diphosphate) 3'-pyrophosphohydrolase [Armatimonadetes bacterium]|nr:bifunctional (p)ppGpp synthetase/guanosine-3',5'-bis(diphosphate) 3'-pyrophosphohydrolase [Armatimonadota bacterium]
MTTAALYEIPHTWEEPEGLLHLLNIIREQNPSANLRRIRYAFFLAEEAHSGQARQSGEPYIMHPLAVALILADLRMDEDTICAGLLHDVLEDCPMVKPELIEAKFGRTVYELVEGVTKLRFKQQEVLTDRQRAAAKSAQAAETLRKMLLAMAKDVRVMVIKLADRLHNMRTLESLPPEKRIRIASETQDIYAPLAARMGIWQMKWQLEDLAFKHLHPKEFQEISELVSKKREVREAELREAIVIMKEALEERGVMGVEVHGRPKHYYSIFNKIVKHGFKFEEILDLIALRVIVNRSSDCYVALGVVHDLWVPIPSLFADYIAKPKPNGYQSLHTKVIGPHGDPLEVQIRTHEMHRVAEFGVAAHWAYKEGAAKPGPDNQITSLRQQLFDWSTDHRTSSDFLRSISTDLFSEQVFVFTPKGDVLDLPAGSTPVDFAFRVHSDLGMTLVGSKVNGQMAQLSTELQNGDVVEIITRSNALPSLDWLEFVKSAHARSKLRHHFRKKNRSENATRGKDALERELKAAGLEPREFLGEDHLEKLAATYSDLESGQDLLAKVGEGLLSVQNVINKLRGLDPSHAQPQKEVFQVTPSKQGRLILSADGVDGIAVKRGRCCEPVPGEDVIGYVSRGRGMVIHRRICPNAVQMQSSEPERMMALQWPPDGSNYSASLKIETVNRQGLLMDISAIFGETKINISAANVRTLPNQTALIEVTVDVLDIAQLNLVMTKISNFSDVISILRTLSGSGSTR